MADGGGINLRLSLKGAEEVRAGLASLGPAGSRAMRELDRAMTTPTAGMRALDATMREARSGLDDFAAGGGRVGALLQSFGPWGMAAAVGFAAFTAAAAAALQISNQATAAAAAMTDTAERIGVGTEALQQWRYAADEAGVPVSALEAGMEKLNGVLGAFKMGLGDAKLKPVFEELGITKARLADVDTADEMLKLLADTLGQVQDRASQVRLAKTLQVEELLPLIRQGSDGIDDLLSRSVQLGVVMDKDVVARLDAADRKAELAGQQLKTLAFSAVEPLATALANAGALFGNLIVKLDRMEARAPGWVKALLSIKNAVPNLMGLGLRVLGGGKGSGSEAEAEEPPAAKPDFDLKGHASGGAGAAQREAEQRRRDAEREIERIRKAEIDAGRDYLRNLVQRGETAEERAHSARLISESEAAEQAWQDDLLIKKIEAAGLMTDEVRARIENIAGIRDLMRQDAERRRQAEEAEKAARAQAEAEAVHLDLTTQILSIASADARTQEERRRIELRLLDIAQRRQRSDLLAAIEAEKEPEARARLVAALDRLPQLFAAQASAVRRDTAGPVEAWWDGQPTSGRANEFLQGEALAALDNVNRGLVDAWTNADSAGDALKRMGEVGVNALARIRDALVEVALQRWLIQPLVNGLFGDGKSGTGLLGGLLGNMTGAIFGGAAAAKSATLSGKVSRGFANGGVNGAAGMVFVGERGIEAVDMPVGARIYDTERTDRILSDAMRRQAGAAIASGPPVVNMPVTIVNRTSEAVQARTRQTDSGIEVLIEPMVRGAVRKMGSDGSLARAHGLTPRGIDR